MDYLIKTVCVDAAARQGRRGRQANIAEADNVIGVDIDPRVIEAVNAGQPYFSEPELMHQQI